MAEQVHNDVDALTFEDALKRLEEIVRKLESGECGWAPQLRECLAFRDIAAVLGEDVALRNVIASAPEIDRPTVQDVLQRNYGRKIEALAIN